MKHAQKMFRAGFQDRKRAQGVEGFFPHGGLPAPLIRAVFEFYQLIHGGLPITLGGGRIARLPIDAGQLTAERGAFVGFILRGNEPEGFVTVAGAEGFLFFGGDVLAVKKCRSKRCPSHGGIRGNGYSCFDSCCEHELSVAAPVSE